MDPKTHFVSDRRLFLDGEGKVVEAGDPNAAELLVAEGGNLPIARAQELGLVDDKGEATPQPRAKARGKDEGEPKAKPKKS